MKKNSTKRWNLAALSLGLFLTQIPLEGQVTVTTPYNFSIIAGTVNDNSFRDGTNYSALFSNILPGIGADSAGNLYVANYGSAIRKIAPVGTNWVTTTIGGGATTGYQDGTNSMFMSASGLAADPAGIVVYVSETEYDISTIRQLTLLGTNWVTATIAGTPYSYGFKDGTNGAAQFTAPEALCLDTNGNLYVSDMDNFAIRKITHIGTNWVTTTIAGGSRGFTDGTNRMAQFSEPCGITMENEGNLFVCDNTASTIRKISLVGTNWVTTTIAGTAGINGSADGTNLTAQFNQPWGITHDSIGNLYVADWENCTIRKISPVGTNWVVTTIGGTVGVHSDLDGKGANATFYGPMGLTFGLSNHLYVTEASCIIRQGINPNVPNLAISYSATDTSASVSWPSSWGMYNLQTNVDLTSSNWVNCVIPLNVSNGMCLVSVPPPLVGNLFFRLSN